MSTFEEVIEELEMAIENALPHEDKAKSYYANRIFEYLHGAQNAIDEWRTGAT